MRRTHLLPFLVCLSCSASDPDLFSPPAEPAQPPVSWTPEPATCEVACEQRLVTPCSCDASDPCGWVGDGICDDACVGVTPVPFDDSLDCATGEGNEPDPAPEPSPEPVDPCGGQCGAKELTTCTCSATDPCGWSENGVCEGDCFYVMPGATFDDMADCFPSGDGTSGSGAAGTCSLVLPGASGQEPDGNIPVCCAPTDVDRAAIDAVFALLNEHRLSRGRAPVTYDPALEAAIQGHCMHMELHDFFSHDAPEAAVRSPWDRAALCGVDAHGENIAWGYESPEEVMEGWRWSPGHNANMLNGNFTRVGIGKYGTYWGQLFGM